MVPRRFSSLITPAFAILAVLVAALAGCSESHAASQPQAITIAAHDYAFVLPDSLRPGPTAFRLQNVGKVPHEAFVLLLKPGATMAQMFDVVKATGRPDSLVEATVGVLMAKPGLTAPGTLLTDLQPGRTYVLACTFEDGPQKLPHFELGMAASRTILTQ
jgi:hypothetical protein